MFDLNFGGDEPTTNDDHRTAGHAETKAQLPSDNFDVPASNPDGTIFYLTVATPHLDTWVVHGPTRTFAGLIPHIKDAVSNSPNAIKKLEAIRANKYLEFDTYGFEQYVIPLERGAHTLLRTHRETNPSLHKVLPAPVYLVTAYGPLQHNAATNWRVATFGLGGTPRGIATKSRVVGSWKEVEGAKGGAREAMKAMLSGGNEKVKVTETGEKGKGGKGSWSFLAMSGSQRWEARVEYKTCDEG